MINKYKNQFLRKKLLSKRMFCYALDIFLDIVFLIIWRPRAIPLGSPWKLTGPPEALRGPMGTDEPLRSPTVAH